MEGLCFKSMRRLFLVDVKSPGGGELSLSACPGLGNRISIEEKIANPTEGGGGGWEGGLVTARIEPCIICQKYCLKKKLTITIRHFYMGVPPIPLSPA